MTAAPSGYSPIANAPIDETVIRNASPNTFPRRIPRIAFHTTSYATTA